MIDKSVLETALRESLDDRRLSRDERHDLKQIAGQGVLDLETRAFVRNRVFAIASEVTEDQSALEVLRWAKDVIKAVESNHGVRSQCEVTFSPGDECLNTVLRHLRTCERRADICVFTITDDRISSEILACVDRGVAVRVISDNDKSLDTGSDVDRLTRRGVPVRVDQSEHHMHHKFAVFDSRKVLTGSYNWTRSAASKNRENILVTDSPGAAASFQEEFERLWTAFA